MKKNLYVLSLGGSIIFPEDQPDVDFIKEFRSLILSRVKKGDRFIIVTGGGKICRKYQHAGGAVRKMPHEDLDRIGIYVTQMNSHFMRICFGEHADDRNVFNINKKIVLKKPIIFGAGWEPGRSTDYDSVKLAKMYGAHTVVNLSNIEKLYTKDPARYPDAKPIDTISWKDFRKIVGNKWTPGLNTPFDPIASKEAESVGLRVVALSGRNMINLKNFFEGNSFVGSVIN